MRIQNEHQEAQVQGITSRSFGFEMNAKMYDILISKMYTNKQGAVIRELSANAWDAHVEAGASETPFDLHLPTWLDKTFHIRDYGTGIPHAKFEHIYTNVGASTKEDSDDLIGGFGLGSKTPFTMTDTFMVENWNSGTKTTWICFKDKGEPQVSKVAEEPSDEPSGLKVSFSFDEGSVDEFTRQVTKQLRFFPVKPNITGGEYDVVFHELPDGWETQDYFYANTKLSSYDNYLVMGNVAYVLSSSEFDYSLRAFFHKGLIIKAPIGAVDIPPSRENLEMTSRTKDYVNGVLTKIKAEYAGDVQKRIKLCVNEWELHKVCYDLNYTILGGNYSQRLLWNGKAIDWSTVKRNHVSYLAGYSLRSIQRSYSNVYRSTQLSMEAVVAGEPSYYLNDLGTGFSKHINNTHNSVPTLEMCIIHVHELTSKNRDEKVKEALFNVEATTGIKAQLLSSVFGFPPAKVKSPTPAAGKSKPNQVFKLDNVHQKYGALRKQMTEQSDLPKESYFIQLKNWTFDTNVSNMRELLGSGVLEFLHKPVYAVRASSVKKLDKSMQELTMDKLRLLEDALVASRTKEKYRQAVGCEVRWIPKAHLLLLPILKDKEIKTFMRYASYFHGIKRNSNVNPAGVYRLIFNKVLECEVEIPKKLIALRDKYSPVGDLLDSLHCRYDTARSETRLKTMINLINQ